MRIKKENDEVKVNDKNNKITTAHTSAIENFSNLISILLVVETFLHECRAGVAPRWIRASCPSKHIPFIIWSVPTLRDWRVRYCAIGFVFSRHAQSAIGLHALTD